MPGWAQVRRRYRLVHEVTSDFGRTGPGALVEWQSAIEAEFGDLGSFLRDVQRRYLTAVHARLDAVLESDSTDLEALATSVLAELAASYPSLLALLDAYAGHSALTDGDAHFRRSIQTATARGGGIRQ